MADSTIDLLTRESPQNTSNTAHQPYITRQQEILTSITSYGSVPMLTCFCEASFYSTRTIS